MSEQLVSDELWRIFKPLLPAELGRHRWVVERTLAWLALRYRRLLVRYERRADVHEAFLHLACVLVCLCYARARSRETDRAAPKPFAPE